MRVTCVAVLLLAAVACGGAPAPAPSPPKAAEPSGQTADGPAQQCLTIADAKRAKRPDEPAKVTVRHVLVKYAGAKKAAAEVTRTREQACLRAQEARAKLEQGADFGAVVKEYSEEPGAASREGTIGAISRSDVVPPFADAAFELERGSVSHVVETDFGFHVIMRTD